MLCDIECYVGDLIRFICVEDEILT